MVIKSATVVRLVRTRRHAATYRDQDQRRGGDDFGRPAMPKKIPGAANVRADGELTGRVRRLHQGPNPQMGQGDPRAEALHLEVAPRVQSGDAQPRSSHEPKPGAPRHRDRKASRERPPRADPPGETMHSEKSERQAHEYGL